jgi:hypothetical protein
MNQSTIEKTEAEVLHLADMLEATLRILHSTAYAPALKAVRVLRVVATDRTIDDDDDRALLKTLVAQLTRSAETVNRPASEYLLDTANVLSTVLAADAALSAA